MNDFSLVFKKKPDFLRGLIIGRFMPLHEGHCFLIESAKKLCKILHICICSTEQDEINGSLRYVWLCEKYALEIAQKIIVIHRITKEIHEAHVNNPGAPAIWAREINKIIKRKINIVFASENYGKDFSKHLDAYFFSIDKNRDIVSISGTQLRKNPYRYWKYLPTVVKKNMVRIIGLQTKKNFLYAKQCARKVKATLYIPYKRRKISSYKNKYDVQMAVSELLVATTISRPIICILLSVGDTGVTCPELEFCENIYAVNTDIQVLSKAEQIKKHIKKNVFWDLRLPLKQRLLNIM